MPAAQGLFAKAIAQSGTANRMGNLDTGAATASGFLERLGLPEGGRTALLEAAVADMLQAQGARGALSPVVDGDTLPAPAARDRARRWCG